jgi:hypothetical protein
VTDTNRPAERAVRTLVRLALSILILREGIGSLSIEAAKRIELEPIGDFVLRASQAIFREKDRQIADELVRGDASFVQCSMLAGAILGALAAGRKEVIVPAFAEAGRLATGSIDEERVVETTKTIRGTLPSAETALKAYCELLELSGHERQGLVDALSELDGERRLENA